MTPERREQLINFIANLSIYDDEWAACLEAGFTADELNEYMDS